MAELEPEEVKSYRCPLCGLHREGTDEGREEIRKHIQDNPIVELPLGLVYESFDNQFFATDAGYFYIVLSQSAERMGESHSRPYDLACINPLYRPPRHPSYFFPLLTITAKGVKHQLREGMLKILSEEKFAEFQEVHKAIIDRLRKENGLGELVRTNPEIDALVGVAQASRSKS
jgi:hypothetical protein